MRDTQHLNDRLWSPIQLAEYLDVPVATLYAWRYQGIGPAGYRVGRHVRYDPADVIRWLKENRSDTRTVT
jgi:DNA-binding transcriptional MerR regulator